MSGRVTYGEFDMWNEDGSITFYMSEEEKRAKREAERKAKFEATVQELASQWLHGIISKDTYDERLMQVTKEYYEV